MEQFRKKTVHFASSDEGVKVAELITLVDNNPLAKEILKLLDVKSILGEIIQIPGSRDLVKIQNAINQKYHKEDLESDLNSISLYSGEDFTINFNALEQNKYFVSLGTKQINTVPIYSATNDFFSELYQMEKYASKLIKDGYKDIVEANLRMLKGIQTLTKKFRILHDREEDNFYLRAIISLSSYFNYDNNIAIVISLLALHEEMKKYDIKYRLKVCEYNESFISMFFESSKAKELQNIGYVRNLIEVSNDEIKREALKFNGVCYISFKDSNNIDNELFIIRPQEIKSRILSIKHNVLPKTAIEELSHISDAGNIHTSLFEDIATITQIKSPEQIKFLLKRKVESAKGDSIKRYKKQILDTLNESTSNIIQLLTLFKKIEIIANEDIDAIEYIRYIVYQALIDRK
ncbi:hypothetical protein [Bacteroides uniformis]|jgi:hypothetical protein|uniref:Uncharacterized protein n=2 Tax=Bacteroides uniformis TaxID=820 RepID=A0AAW6GQA1_BACUN|nr:hypothetical protein [Bacteroides uniformis]MDC1881190.1 hypothetical protein [Bacteroides uniformis]MDC1885211.1 hypothetical protein [Bacteroides uniformis]